MVEPHNQSAAALWNAGGDGYDTVSYAISDALAHAAQRLWARPGERILDIATGTGWTARNVARSGAAVTGIDIAEELLAAAQRRSAHLSPSINFQQADAEALPFDDASFDGVVSTFGIMFAPRQAEAAAEAARVCKPGGRLVVAAWQPEGYIARFFGLVAEHAPAASAEEPEDAGPSPMVWGDEAGVRALLGDSFNLSFETRDSYYYAPDGQAVWDEYKDGFGPIASLLAQLDATAAAAFRAAFLAMHDEYREGVGLTLRRRYLLTVGTRK